ncbi:hypothetical protein [Flavihumibacter petaseus]|uniref:ZU5 domain-containing protein n=1 Tax=Flavihumibacter petaseus NBRC 106054 TaxID=1220578 RepID=A0A0E9N306_9BACT|nr:hypothetical protein [Flavihumibacter petaseus]GAO44214.1 hypothetical protein FPE01S_03_02520 [Flavihumibacter petaseus NBRC 106054]
MKKNRILLLLLVALGACSKHHPETPPDGAVTQPLPAPAGQPIGESEIFFIGTDGGIIESEDGIVKIDIPAGALDAETEISIQPLHNTASHGIGQAYRLTPHGNIFRKKVTLTFNYWKYRHVLSGPQAVEIATQDDKGFWTGIGGTVNDTAQKIVSVKSDHFSDWALIESMELSPAVKTVSPGEAIRLQALRYVFPVAGDDWVVPLTHPAAGSGEPLKIEATYIRKWTLNGPGKLEPNGSEAVYTAPTSTGGSRSATISLELSVSGSKVLLISTIYFIEDGISLSINGGSWQQFPAMAFTMQESNLRSLTNLRTNATDPQMVFLWPENDLDNETHYWYMHNVEDADVTFEWDDPSLDKTIVSFFFDGEKTYDSGGFLATQELEKDGKKYLTGVFIIDKAGEIDRTNGEQISVKRVIGTYKVQRDW